VLSFLVALSCSGCFSKPVYVPNGVVVEIRRPTIVSVWVRDKRGVVHKGTVLAGSGWLLGKPKGFGGK